MCTICILCIVQIQLRKHVLFTGVHSIQDLICCVQLGVYIYRFLGASWVLIATYIISPPGIDHAGYSAPSRQHAL